MKGLAPGSTPGKHPIPNWHGTVQGAEPDWKKNGMPDCARKIVSTAHPEKSLSPAVPELPMNRCPFPIGISYREVSDRVCGTSWASSALLRCRWYGEMRPA